MGLSFKRAGYTFEPVRCFQYRTRYSERRFCEYDQPVSCCYVRVRLHGKVVNHFLKPAAARRWARTRIEGMTTGSPEEVERG